MERILQSALCMFTIILCVWCQKPAMSRDLTLLHQQGQHTPINTQPRHMSHKILTYPDSPSHAFKRDSLQHGASRSPNPSTWWRPLLTHTHFASHEQCVETVCGPKPVRYNADDSGMTKGSPAFIPVKPAITKRSTDKKLKRQRRMVPAVAIANPSPYMGLNPLEHQGIDNPIDINANLLKDVNQARALLGRGSRVLRDASGNIIGIAAADPKDSYKPSSQGHFPRNDGAICCPTLERLMINYTLSDYFGTSHNVYHDPAQGVYQFIRHGICGSTGACPGQCEQMYVTTVIAVTAPGDCGNDVSFRFFSVPGYCTCRVPASGPRFSFGGNNFNDLVLKRKPIKTTPSTLKARPPFKWSPLKNFHFSLPRPKN